TPYFYYVHTVTLTDSEQSEWGEVTKRIARLYSQQVKEKTSSADSGFQIKRLLIERSRILKQAEAKVVSALKTIAGYYQRGERWIVYCDDLAQLIAVRGVLAKNGIQTMEYHSSMEGDKEQTLRLFEANGGIVVSIRCLDEGVDIPSVTHALILASSKNPREYIQRRGRVLRRAEGKSVAYIHDTIVLPSAQPSEGEQDLGIDIIGGELTRALQFGKSALNPAAVTDLERIALQYSTDLKTLLSAGYEEEE